MEVFQYMNDNALKRRAAAGTDRRRPGVIVRRTAGLICALLAVVTSVDISASAKGLIAARGVTDLWVSDAYRYCPKGNKLAIMREGIPDEGGPWDEVLAGDVTVRVPRGKRYRNDVPRIVSTTLAGTECLAVAGEIEK